MKREDGLSIISLILIIAVLIALAVFAGQKILGKDGLWDRYKESDNEYNKTEIVDSLNFIIQEKHVLDYKYAAENNQNPADFCTSENFFKYLIDSGYIEQLKDINDNLVENQYYINAESLNADLNTNLINKNGSESNGTKVYKIKILENKYMIYYVDKYGEEIEIGELNMNPDVK